MCLQNIKMCQRPRTTDKNQLQNPHLAFHGRLRKCNSCFDSRESVTRTKTFNINFPCRNIFLDFWTPEEVPQNARYARNGDVLPPNCKPLAREIGKESEPACIMQLCPKTISSTTFAVQGMDED